MKDSAKQSTSLLLSVLARALSKTYTDVSIHGVFHKLKLALHYYVPLVFYVIVGAACDHIWYFGPSVLISLVHDEQNPVLFIAPWASF